MAGAIKLVADVAVIAERRVLLVRYRDTRRYDDPAGSLPTVSHIESLANGAWHLVFHYLLELGPAPRVSAGTNVAAFEWFALDAPPAADEVAHCGWALDVLSEIERMREARV